LKVNPILGTIPLVKNIKITLAYEGSAYLGWQKTETGPSIEEELEKILTQILQHPIQLQAASRTDAGVHAEAQVINFFSNSSTPLERLKKSCNSLLPEDIRVLKINEASSSFHPTLDAKGKEYHYHVCLGPTQLPFDRRFSWHFVKPVDLRLMQQAATLLIGTHDFSALTNEKKENNIREIYHIDIEEIAPQRIRICVSGNHFLYKMVRNIVGTLLYVGCGMLPIETIFSLLKKGDRREAGMTAPAHGLILKRVIYD
jgi:tRNA pseudouridine38-40 synthase